MARSPRRCAAGPHPRARLGCWAGGLGGTAPASRTLAGASWPLRALILIIFSTVDRKAYLEGGLKDWLPMRLHLTVVAALSCLIGAAAT